MYRRGHSAGNAAVLVGIVAGVMILYILFLPPDVRDDLLNGNGTTINGVEYNETPLLETPGRLDYLKFDQIEHTLPSFRIYATKEGKAIKDIDSLYVKDGLFEDVVKEVTFEVDPDTTDNLLLSFNVDQADGNLIILLNNHEIFNRALIEGSPRPITLPRDYLEYDNVLTFKTDSPGIAFWATHEYQLSTVVVTADVLDLSNSDAIQHFFITGQEKDNLETATVWFYPRCSTASVGKLSITLNDFLVYSTLADCGVMNKFTVSDQDIMEGENSLEFSTEQGSYLIDNLEVRTHLKEQIYPVYYFELDRDLFRIVDEKNPEDDVLDDDYDVILTLRFPDNEDKRADIYVNGHKFSLNTDSTIFERNIDSYVFHGTNSIEIIPKIRMDVQQLRVDVKD